MNIVREVCDHLHSTTDLFNLFFMSSDLIFVALKDEFVQCAHSICQSHILLFAFAGDEPIGRSRSTRESAG